MTKKQKIIILLTIQFLFSILYTIPMFAFKEIKYFNNQDTIFHLSRIIGLSNVLESPVNFNNFAHHGTAMNLFYPWLTVYPMYIFFKVTNDLVMSYNLFYLLITYMTLCISYFSIYKIKRNNSMAFLFSLIYTFATYRSVDIFQRGALGEAVALTFLPLIFLGCYMIFFSNLKEWYYLTIGMTLTLYTHLLSVAIISIIILIGILFTIFFWVQPFQRLISLIKATVWTLILSVGFLIPFVQQTSAYQLKTPEGGVLKGSPLSNLFNNGLNNDLFTYTIGFFIIVFSVITLMNIAKKKNKNIDDFIFLFGIILFFITSSLFPWRLISDSPINKIQFLWRLNAYSTLFLSYGIASFFAKMKNKKNVSMIAIVILLLVLHVSSVINLYTDHSSTGFGSNAAHNIAMSYNHTDYANRKTTDNKELINQNKFFLDNEEIEPEIKYSDTKYEIKFESSKSGKILTTPIYKYLGQKILINGNKSVGKLSQLGTTAVTIPKGKVKVVIKYEYTFLAKLSILFNIIFLIIFILKIKIFDWL